MFKVLFLPLSTNQTEIYIKIKNELDDRNITSKFLSIDSFYKKRFPNYLAEPMLKDNGLSFKKIEDYLSMDPETILTEERPNLIVNSQDAMDPTIRKFELAAKKHKIPVIVIQDAIMLELNPPYNSPEQLGAAKRIDKIRSLIRDACNVYRISDYGLNWSMRLDRIIGRFNEIQQGTSTRWGDGEYTKIAVSGSHTRDMLISRGIEESKIVITGQPRYDDLIDSIKANERSLRKHFGFDLNKKMVLLTTQPLVESRMWSAKDRTYFITNIIRLISGEPDYYLVIKLHPRDRFDSYKYIIEKNGLNDCCRICQNENTFSLIKCCDLLLTHICTTALEAMILGKPVLTIDFKQPTSDVCYVKAGASIGINHPKDLMPSIYKILSDDLTGKSFNEEQKKFIYQYCYEQDGLASKRVSDLIIDTINSSFMTSTSQ